MNDSELSDFYYEGKDKDGTKRFQYTKTTAESVFRNGKSWKEASRISPLRAVLPSLQGKNKKFYKGFLCSLRYHTVFSRKQSSTEYLAEAMYQVRHFSKKVLLFNPDNIPIR